MKYELPARGRMLVSEPFLFDPNFNRTVILLCEHYEDGSVGFVLNRMLGMNTDEIVPGLLSYNFPVFYGGPVEQNTLHFIHRCGHLISKSQEITEGVWWGGDIDDVNDLLAKKLITPQEIKFFVGYSGWSAGQLIDEMEQKAWWVVGSEEQTIFTDDLEEMWRNVVKSMGSGFLHLANAPIDPQWN